MLGGDGDTHQNWATPVFTPTRVSGHAKILLFVAAHDFSGEATIGARATLSICRPDCTAVRSGLWSGKSVPGGFRMALLDLGSIDTTLEPGQAVMLHVDVPAEISAGGVILGYDTTDQPSRLIIG